MDTTTGSSLDDLRTFQNFAAEFERLGLGSEHSLRWLVRFRAENGLLESGAVIERRLPGSKRPRLFINTRRFADWFATSDPARRAA